MNPPRNYLYEVIIKKNVALFEKEVYRIRRYNRKLYRE